MLKGTSAALYQYREKCDSHLRLSDRLAEKASDAMMRSEDGLKGVFNAVKLVLFGLPYIVVDKMAASKKKKRLCNLLHCSPEEIAMDINKLAEKQAHIKYYGDSFTYSVATPKKWLKNIRMIFGDAHLEALDEMACLASLNSVWGSVYVSRCTDLQGLNLAIIKGDLHGEKLKSANGLEKLIFVGGTIFYQDRQFPSLDEFRCFLNTP